MAFNGDTRSLLDDRSYTFIYPCMIDSHGLVFGYWS